MNNDILSKWTKTAVLFLALGAAGVVNAKTVELGTLGIGNHSFNVTELINPGTPFANFVSFGLNNPAHATSFIRSFELSILEFDLLGIDNFSATLQQAGPGGFQDLTTISSGPITFDELLNPGQYRIAFNGIGSGFLGGLYSGGLQVAVVPEAEVWLMLLVGFAIVLYQLRRKQRLLEQQPVAA